MASTAISRRSLLSSAVLIGGSILGSSILTGCTGGSSSSSGTGSGGKVSFPSYVPSTLIKPDLPGSGLAVQSGFYNYPLDRVRKSVDSAPGTGNAVTFLTLTFGAVGTPKGQNQYWQYINKQLNADMNVESTPADSFGQKVQTTIAGGQIPDMLTFGPAYPIPQTPALLKAKFTPLTKYLAGDAVKEYPNLAAIPTDAWRGTVFNGEIYGVPCARPTAGAPIIAYADYFEKVGITEAPKTLDDLATALKAVTDPKRSIWGVSNPFSAVYYARFAYGAPNAWAENGGKFLNEIETDEYQEAVAWAAQLQKDGALHPDTITVEDGNRMFAARNVATTLGSATGWPGAYTTAVKAGAKLAAWTAPPASGRKAVLYAGPGYGFFTAFGKTDDEARIKELLRIANWIAAPFGSQEHLALTYGIEGVHYTVKNGIITPTDLAKKEKGVSFSYVANGEIPACNPGYPDSTRTIHAWEQGTQPMLVKDASIGLSSPTADSKNSALATLVSNAVNDIVLGRKPVSAWKNEVVPAWKNAGGDQVRKDYEQAFAAANS